MAILPAFVPLRAPGQMAADATPPPAAAVAAEAAAPAPSGPAAQPDKRARAGLEKLGLKDPAKEARVLEILGAHAADLKAWRAVHDSEIKKLWAAYDKARSPKVVAVDPGRAPALQAQIDAIYATFRPNHDAFLASLGQLLTPDQIAVIEDSMTVGKVEFTMRSFTEMFPNLTPEQKGHLIAELDAARDEAIEAGSMLEKSAFFKKHKLRIQAYLDAQGLDFAGTYKAYVDRINAAKKAGRPAASATLDPMEEAPETAGKP